MAIAVAFLAFPAANKTTPSDLGLWPAASQQAAKATTEKYGNADLVSSDVMIWLDRGPWKRITVSRAGYRHSFPHEHLDVIEHTIKYKVPPDKFDDLGTFDGSLLIDRTRGTISARCDYESSNVLALNLAHDLVNELRTVEEARDAYGKLLRDKMSGGDPALMKDLTFGTLDDSADPDINTTGLIASQPGAKRRWFSLFTAGTQ